ncbi:DsbA family oxidoreductase [Geofilum rubicundum]|uniref:2-hydroxychromene-2-carboxylate isomerase/DsbA-like thioredoxin domain n=1 Tax=Geofilum rubicundum JCM 15548 TaxID=1236989 RepID=A0A0E9LZI5_9BACT|nr:DsbA family oxidoreductase [Geofilum rubicundum]GAO30664.1 2-hydroxychromene-2-carboxylate isomerase/DsbA-like thioredoxin domain [Geofilum rubicundum JCM 15548]
MNNKKVKVEIWTDVMCPFCYIGKRKFEAGLAKFAHKDEVEVIWKSFQLDPELKNDGTLNLTAYMARRKSVSLEEAATMSEGATQKAAMVGLHYNLDKVIPSNTLKAHQLAHFAKKHGLQSQAEELLFRSYFIDGQDIDKDATLLQLVEELGLSTETFKGALDRQTYVPDVKADIAEAKALGIRMIPHFLVNRQYVISGSYDSQTFTDMLTKAYNEEQQSPIPINIEFTQGDSCDLDGNCD